MCSYSGVKFSQVTFISTFLSLNHIKNYISQNYSWNFEIKMFFGFIEKVKIEKII